MNLAPFPAWRLKLRKADDSLEGQRQFHDLRTLLIAAALLREERPDLRLIITVPSEASGEERGFIQKIANRVPAGPAGEETLPHQAPLQARRPT
jgi:hypothetical protein